MVIKPNEQLNNIQEGNMTTHDKRFSTVAVIAVIMLGLLMSYVGMSAVDNKPSIVTDCPYPYRPTNPPNGCDTSITGSPTRRLELVQ